MEAHGPLAPRARKAHRRQAMNLSALADMQASLSEQANKPKPTAPAVESPKAPAASPPAPAQSTAKPAPAPVAATTTPQAPAAAATTKPAAQAQTTAAAPVATGATGKVGAPQPGAPPPSSASSASVEPVKASSTVAKAATSSSLLTASSSATQGVRTTTPVRNVSSGVPTASPAAASSTSSSISGGAVAGIVIGLIAGIIVIGGVAGWLYRKYKDRNYDNHASAWTKMNEDSNNGVTPYRNDPKMNASDEEFYSGLPPAAPSTHHGSTHHGSIHHSNNGFHQQQPQHGYYQDDMRPDSMAMMDSNLAGYGAGVRSGPYPDPAPVAMSYDANGRPYTPTQHNGQWGYDHHQQQQYGQNPFDDANRMNSPPGSLHSPNSPQNQNFGAPRQLVGPGQNYAGAGPVPVPVPLGRPQPPQSYDDIAAAEMYADDRYADDHMAAPVYPVNYAQQQQQTGVAYSPQSFTTAEAHTSGPAGQRSMSPVSPVSPIPTSVVHTLPAPLPAMQPMSPLMNAVPLMDDDVQPHHDSSRMYGEVARAAGVPDPSAAPPLSPTMQQDFSAPVMPYQHGIPLSPLTEVPTPASSHAPLMPDAPVPAETSVAQRVTVPTASPAIVSAAPSPRPLPAIPQQQPKASSSNDTTPASGAAPARPASVDDAYGGI